MHEEETVKKDHHHHLTKQLLESRTVLIYGEIDQDLARRVTAELLVLDNQNHDPITVFINSQGGHVEAGDTIHDMIRFVQSPVYMVGTGWVASAGTTIYLAAQKENRLSMPNTRYMIHQPMGGVQGQTTDIKIEAQELIRVRRRLNELIAAATGQPIEKIEEDTNRNLWMSNEEAIAYGIVGRVVERYDQVKG